MFQSLPGEFSQGQVRHMLRGPKHPPPARFWAMLPLSWMARSCRLQCILECSFLTQPAFGDFPVAHALAHASAWLRPKGAQKHVTAGYGFGSTSTRCNARDAQDDRHRTGGDAAFRWRGLFGRKVMESDSRSVTWPSARYVVTLLGPLMAVYGSRRYGVTLLGPLLDGLWQSPVSGSTDTQRCQTTLPTRSSPYCPCCRSR